MKITQKQRFRNTFEFLLDGTTLTVRTLSLTGESGYEVQLKELSPSISFHRCNPIGWFGAGIFLWLAAAISVLLAFFGTPGDSTILFGASSFICPVLGSMFLYGAYQRKKDWILFHWKESGAVAFVLYRTLPTETHVKEYVEILKQKIDEIEEQATKKKEGWA